MGARPGFLARLRPGVLHDLVEELNELGPVVPVLAFLLHEALPRLAVIFVGRVRKAESHESRVPGLAPMPPAATHRILCHVELLFHLLLDSVQEEAQTLEEPIGVRQGRPVVHLAPLGLQHQLVDLVLPSLDGLGLPFVIDGPRDIDEHIGEDHRGEQTQNEPEAHACTDARRVEPRVETCHLVEVRLAIEGVEDRHQREREGSEHFRVGSESDEHAQPKADGEEDQEKDEDPGSEIEQRAAQGHQHGSQDGQQAEVLDQLCPADDDRGAHDRAGDLEKLPDSEELEVRQGVALAGVNKVCNAPHSFHPRP
mmetsp:Transcript_12974/g.48100  ORF Transcript_12974/g.48100 Transcript_12974/m.48100 type:complete len:311 (-) Transcript_12974:1848-2780(-)